MKEFVIKKGVLTKYKGNASHVVIPNNVTKIGSCAFFNCKNLISIEIPSSVVEIEVGAFKNCENLTNVEIPNSVTIIGDWLFSFCESIASIVIPNSVTSIGFAAFDNCKSLKSIEIPSSVTDINSYAFDDCECLSRIKIPSSVTYIGFYAFCNVRNVKTQYKANGALRAFKGFDGDWSCRGFQYEIGKSFHQDGYIKCCEYGFHACPNPLDVFNYYGGELRNLHFAEVELSGTMDWTKDKVAASDIKIIRELTASELAEIYNSMEKE